MSIGLWSRTIGGHEHSFGFQRSHVRAAHVGGTEINVVARSEPCVVEQRLDIAEVRVVFEFQATQAREPAQRTDVGDRVTPKL